MLTCNCFATFEISKYRKNSLSKLSAWSFLKWNRPPASTQESAERAQDAIIQTCYVVSPQYFLIVANLRTGTCAEIEIVGFENRIGPARSELQVGT